MSTRAKIPFLEKMAGDVFHAKPVFAKHRQWEEYDHYLSHQLNVQISLEFPPGKVLYLVWGETDPEITKFRHLWIER